MTKTPQLVLAGATGYEGTICHDRTPACLDEVRVFLDRLGALTSRLRADGLVETDEAWVSAGGSAFFDLVVERLGPSGEIADRVLLRSGSYVAHDVGVNERTSPFAHLEPERRFHSGDRGVGRRALTSRAGARDPRLRAAGRAVRPGPPHAVHDRGAGPENVSTSRVPWSSSG